MVWACVRGWYAWQRGGGRYGGSRTIATPSSLTFAIAPPLPLRCTRFHEAVVVVHGEITGPRVTIQAVSVHIKPTGAIHSDGTSFDTAGTTGSSNYGLSHGGQANKQVMLPCVSQRLLAWRAVPKEARAGSANTATNTATNTTAVSRACMHRYGSPHKPTEPGKRGRSDTLPGGGVVRLIVAGALTIDTGGRVSADATGEVEKRGPGSGGSVWIDCASVHGGGSVRARGGDAFTSTGYTAGAGGRVALYAAQAGSSFHGRIDADSGVDMNEVRRRCRAVVCVCVRAWVCQGVTASQPSLTTRLAALCESQERPGTVYLSIPGIVDGRGVHVSTGTELLHLYTTGLLLETVRVREGATLGISGGATLNATAMYLEHGATIVVGNTYDRAQAAVGFGSLAVVGGSTTDGARVVAASTPVRLHAWQRGSSVTLQYLHVASESGGMALDAPGVDVALLAPCVVETGGAWSVAAGALSVGVGTALVGTGPGQPFDVTVVRDLSVHGTVSGGKVAVTVPRLVVSSTGSLHADGGSLSSQGRGLTGKDPCSHGDTPPYPGAAPSYGSPTQPTTPGSS